MTQPPSPEGSQEELLPCPWCGGTERVFISSGSCGHSWTAHVACTQCDDSSGPHCCWFSSQEESEKRAIQAWNTRATPKEPSPVQPSLDKAEESRKRYDEFSETRHYTGWAWTFWKEQDSHYLPIIDKLEKTIKRQGNALVQKYILDPKELDYWYEKCERQEEIIRTFGILLGMSTLSCARSSAEETEWDRVKKRLADLLDAHILKMTKPTDDAPTKADVSNSNEVSQLNATILALKEQVAAKDKQIETACREIAQCNEDTRELEKEIDRLQKGFESSELTQLQAHNKQLLENEGKMREALCYYANKDSWYCNQSPWEFNCGDDNPWDVAAVALDQTKEKL